MNKRVESPSCCFSEYALLYSGVTITPSYSHHHSSATTTAVELSHYRMVIIIVLYCSSLELLVTTVWIHLLRF